MAHDDCPPNGGGGLSPGAQGTGSAAITVPYSLQMAAGDGTKDAVAGAVVTVVAANFKIFLGAAVDPGKRQQYVGALRACYRKAMAEGLKDDPGTDIVAYGSATGASDGNVVVATDTTLVGTGDVAIVISSTFGGPGGTHFLTETFNQLLNALLENSKAN